MGYRLKKTAGSILPKLIEGKSENDQSHQIKKKGVTLVISNENKLGLITPNKNVFEQKHYPRHSTNKQTEEACKRLLSAITFLDIDRYGSVTLFAF